MNNQQQTQKTKKKILLLHGWDWRKYPKFNPIHQWQNRQPFLDLMKGEFDVDYPSLPGFGNGHSTNRLAWTLDDYADWLRERVRSHRYDGLIGYSFGASVILKYFRLQSSLNNLGPKSVCPAILISPAIVRKYKAKGKGTVSRAGRAIEAVLGKKMYCFLKHIYMTVWVRNKFYTQATPFLRDTYMNIVEENLSDELRQVLVGKSEENVQIKLVFGEKDNITPPTLLFSQVPEAQQHAALIEHGDHHIGTTHPQKLFRIIQTTLNKTTSNNTEKTEIQ